MSGDQPEGLTELSDAVVSGDSLKCNVKPVPGINVVYRKGKIDQFFLRKLIFYFMKYLIAYMAMRHSFGPGECCAFAL